jgi:hypothetical protein
MTPFFLRNLSPLDGLTKLFFRTPSRLGSHEPGAVPRSSYWRHGHGFHSFISFFVLLWNRTTSTNWISSPGRSKGFRVLLPTSQNQYFRDQSNYLFLFQCSIPFFLQISSPMR